MDKKSCGSRFGTGGDAIVYSITSVGEFLITLAHVVAGETRSIINSRKNFHSCIVRCGCALQV